jgi:hypothetical protein
VSSVGLQERFPNFSANSGVVVAGEMPAAIVFERKERGSHEKNIQGPEVRIQERISLRGLASILRLIA